MGLFFKEEAKMYIDLHCDTILGLWEKERRQEPASLLENDLHVDLKKMKKGGCLLQTFALFTDRMADIPEKRALELYDAFMTAMEANRDDIGLVKTWGEYERNKAEGRMSALLSLEDGGVVYGGLAMLRNWQRMGVRMIALTWNYPNGIGHPNQSRKSFSDYRQPDYAQVPETELGLTAFGRAYVQEMERLHMLCDVSHLSDKGFWDVMDICQGPVIASHSNARAVCPAARNLTDEMIQAIAKRGGVIGLNFCAGFLKEEPESRMEDMVRHLKHIKDVGGVQVLALGSDFDGITSHLEVENASRIPILLEFLKKNGFTSSEIEQISHKNVERVLKMGLI
jgi:membrane dipeptidase